MGRGWEFDRGQRPGVLNMGGGLVLQWAKGVGWAGSDLRLKGGLVCLFNRYNHKDQSCNFSKP